MIADLFEAVLAAVHVDARFYIQFAQAVYNSHFHPAEGQLPD